MVIMLIFLLLTIAFVIGTSVYLNHNKKTVNINNKQNSKNNTKQKNKKSNKKQLADIFDFKIKDNIICLGNRYSNVIRLGNVDYNMLSDTEQETIENVLIQTALAIDYPIQFFSTTEFIDTSKVISLLKKNKIGRASCRERV